MVWYLGNEEEQKAELRANLESMDVHCREDDTLENLRKKWDKKIKDKKHG